MVEKLDLSVIGTSGLKQYGGLIDEEFHPKLKGLYGPKVYKEMGENSSTIGAIQFIIEALIRQVEWRVEPASEEKPAVEAAEFLDGCMEDMSITWEDFISEVLSMLQYGWAYFETVYKLRKGDSKNSKMRSKFNDGKIGWRKLALRSQDTLDHWEFDQEDTSLRGMWQQDLTGGLRVFIPIEKSILFRTKITKNNPEGRSIYRNAVVDYFFLKRICEIEAIGIERDMTGLLTMEVPIEILRVDADGSAKALRSQLEKMLSELKRDEREYAIVPSEMDKEGKPTGYKLKLLSTGGARQINTNETKLYYKVNILQSVLAQFIQLGMSNVGSFALSSDQTDLFAVALGSFLGNIQSTINRYLVDRLMELNGVAAEHRPWLEHGDIESPPLAEIGQFIQMLGSIGLMPDDDRALKRRLYELARLPIPDEGNEVQKQVIASIPLRLVRNIRNVR